MNSHKASRTSHWLCNTIFCNKVIWLYQLTCYGGQFNYIFILVDITKLPCFPQQRSTTVSLETFTLYFLYGTVSFRGLIQIF